MRPNISLTENMASSRIFIKGLPPTITEAEARKHFSAGSREITDIKLIQHRRIGYIGNRSYVRMSKISVEPAKAVSSHPPPCRCLKGLSALCSVGGVCADWNARSQTRP